MQQKCLNMCWETMAPSHQDISVQWKQYGKWFLDDKQWEDDFLKEPTSQKETNRKHQDKMSTQKIWVVQPNLAYIHSVRMKCFHYEIAKDKIIHQPNTKISKVFCLTVEPSSLFRLPLFLMIIHHHCSHAYKSLSSYPTHVTHLTKSSGIVAVTTSAWRNWIQWWNLNLIWPGLTGSDPNYLIWPGHTGTAPNYLMWPGPIGFDPNWFLILSSILCHSSY